MQLFQSCDFSAFLTQGKFPSAQPLGWEIQSLWDWRTEGPDPQTPLGIPSKIAKNLKSVVKCMSQRDFSEPNAEP
jgi:hypothetical protein